MPLRRASCSLFLFAPSPTDGVFPWAARTIGSAACDNHLKKIYFPYSFRYTDSVMAVICMGKVSISSFFAGKPYICSVISTGSMKSLQKMLFGILFLLAACAGGEPEECSLLLERVDSLLFVRPDSAWRLLRQVPSDAWRSEALQARYALLQTEAAIRCGRPLADDSLILSAVEYYGRAGDAGMQARARYWAGNVYRRLQDGENALRQYWKAEELAREAEDRRLLGAIYNNWAYLYGLQGLYERSDSLYQLAGRIGELLPDSVLWAETLCRRASIYMEQGGDRYGEAEKLLMQAHAIGVGFRNKQLQRIVLNLLTALYGRMGCEERALETAKQYLVLQEDTSRAYVAYRMLGFAYYWNRQYDAASYYLNRALPITDYRTKISIYECLADMARREGKDGLAQRMAAKASSYKDSLIVDKSTLSLVEAEKEVAFSYREQRQTSRMIEYVIGGFLFGSLILGVIIFIFYLRHRVWKQEKAHWGREKTESIQRQHQMLEQLEEVQELLHQSQANLEEKEAQMTDLQERIGKRVVKENRKYMALQQEELECQPVYLKMKKIMEEYAQHEKSNEKMMEEDWLQWEEVANRRWNQICLKLRGYGLTNVELRLCSMLLTDVPVARIGCLFGRQRNFCYTTQKKIWDKRLKSDFETCANLKEVLEYMANTP